MTVSFQLEANWAMIRQHQGWAAILSNGHMVMESFPVRQDKTALSPWQTLLSEVERTPAVYIRQVVVTRGTTTLATPIYDPTSKPNGVDGLVSMYRQTRALQPGSKPLIEQAVGHVIAKLGLVFVTLVTLDGYSVRSSVDKMDDVWLHSTLRANRDILYKRSL